MNLNFRGARGRARGRVLSRALFFFGACFIGRFAAASSPQQSGTHSRLEEISPLIEDIEIVKGDPYLEVFISGVGHLDCYDVREFQVDKLSTSTQIIPKLRRSSPEKPCTLGLKKFRDKAADLDPNSPSSNEIHVLGFRGWHKRILKP